MRAKVIGWHVRTSRRAKRDPIARFNASFGVRTLSHKTYRILLQAVIPCSSRQQRCESQPIWRDLVLMSSRHKV